MKFLFYAKQCLKMFLQNALLPQVYGIYRHKPIKKNLVIFADAHNDELPYSMKRMYQAVASQGYDIKVFCLDFSAASFLKIVKFLFLFMKAFATAGTVFICDYFLPVSSCRKRKETQVVQLWHACGAFKKFGYDAREDISGMYRGNPLGNCTLVTVSSKECEPIYSQALHLPRSIVKATGVSRTDIYFDEAYKAACRKQFYELHPEAKGCRILLWAPTFRGNAGAPKVEGIEAVSSLQEKLGPQWYVIIKLHPHLERRLKLSTCEMKTEDLMMVADVLLTDYSSVLFEFMLMKKPVVLFAPDNKAYLKHRGFYLDYQSIPAVHVRDAMELPYAVKSALTGAIDTTDFCERYIGCCDGNATERIIRLVFQEVNG